jgi:hypothetical protein
VGVVLTLSNDDSGFIANLSKADRSWGCVSGVDSNGRTIFVADAHRDGGKRFVVHADEKLTAFMELQAAIRLGRLQVCTVTGSQ